MKRIVWQMPDGSIRITTPCSPVRDNESENDYLNRVAEKCKPEGAIRIADINKDDIPSDRSYRNAWIVRNGKIEIDVIKKQSIDDHRERVAVDALVVEEIKALALDSLKKKGLI